MYGFRASSIKTLLACFNSLKTFHTHLFVCVDKQCPTHITRIYIHRLTENGGQKYSNKTN